RPNLPRRRPPRSHRARPRSRRSPPRTRPGEMPELPDVTVYLEALAARVNGRKLLGVRLASPFVLRTFDPPLSAAAGKKVLGLRRVGKRLVLALEGDLFLVMHLMIAGRLKWLDAGAKIPGKVGL